MRGDFQTKFPQGVDCTKKVEDHCAKLLSNASIFFLHLNHSTVNHRWRTQTAD